MKYFLSFLTALLLLSSCKETITNHEMVTRICDEITNSEDIITNLQTITTNYPARLSGSANNAGAVQFVQSTLDGYHPDSLWLQDVEIVYWTPGRTEVYLNLPQNGKQYLECVPLGTSAGTKGKAVTGDIVEILTQEDLDKVNLKGKIAFFNMKMDDSVNTYGVAGWQRIHGPSEASRRGAKAAIVRSITTLLDNNPHTGVTRFDEGVKPIPAVAISTIAAENVSSVIKNKKGWKLSVKSTSATYPDTIGRNVVAQLTGSKNPENIILVSAHLDSWFNSQGAQDNAVDCCYAMELIRVFKKLNIQPNNTIRILTYQDEEMYLRGMHAYSDSAVAHGERHIFDLELDAGAGGPKAFLLFAPKEKVDSISRYVMPALFHVGVKKLIARDYESEWPIVKTGAYFSLYRPQGEHYFDIHHSANDNIDTIDFKQVKQSACAVVSYIYMLDRYYGLESSLK